MFKHFYLIILNAALLSSCSDHISKEPFTLKEGDLLFQNTGSSEIDQAIKEVTATKTAKNYSHVGMAILEDGQWHVVEAIPENGVCVTPLKDFLNRNTNQNHKSRTTVARLNSYYESFISDAIQYGIQQLKKPYDDIFLWDDQAYYCSELIYKMFSIQEDLPLDSIPFDTHPMTFNDSTGNPMPSWVSYYEERHSKIPEGITGTNPNLLASSPFIQFIHDYEKE